MQQSVVARVVERAKDGALQRARVGQKGQRRVRMCRHDHPLERDSLVIVGPDFSTRPSAQ